MNEGGITLKVDRDKCAKLSNAAVTLPIGPAEQPSKEFNFYWMALLVLFRDTDWGESQGACPLPLSHVNVK